MLFLNCILTPFIQAQNSSNYFVVPLKVEFEQPRWAQLMYDNDPNVFDVDRALHEYLQSHRISNDFHFNNYQHWRKLVTPLLNEEGYIRPLNQAQETLKFNIDKLRRSTFESTSRMGTSWECIGPIETFRNGSTETHSYQASIYTLDQSKSNSSILYAGTESGGVFKSFNKGISWILVSTQDEFVQGISAIQIHPTDQNIIFVGGNRRIYSSTNAGNNWTEILFTNGIPNEIRFNPTNPNEIYVSCSSGFYQSIDGGINWSTVWSDPTYDVEFQPNNSDSIFTLRGNSSTLTPELYRSIDGGTNWVNQTTGWYVPENISTAVLAGGKIAISPAAPNKIYAGLVGDSKSGDLGWIGVYRSDDGGDNWSLPAGQIGGPYNPANTMPWAIAADDNGIYEGFHAFDLEVSATDSNKLWVGTVRLSESNDGGTSFVSIGGANSTRLNHIHSGIHDLEVNDGDIWVASDGGINYSFNEMGIHVSTKRGISAAEMLGFDSGWNENILVGGKMHNGNSAHREGFTTGDFVHLGGGEEATGYVNPFNNNIYLGANASTNINTLPNAIGNNFTQIGTLDHRPNESIAPISSSEITFDPRYADHLYLGKENGIWFSRTGGASFTLLHSFTVGHEVLSIKISRHNPDVIFASVRTGTTQADDIHIFNSSDGGLTWSQLTNPATDLTGISFTLNPASSSEIWISSLNGSNSEKVYRSTDSGNTWINQTTNDLDNQKLYDILFQGGTDSKVYVASETGVLYWDNSGGQWVDYSSSLPLYPLPLKFKPFYKENALRLATSGRGIWSIDFQENSLPLAQPMTSTDSLYCDRDSVEFDCHSILNHSGSSWQWSFSPTPQFVSDPTIRNPKVVFGSVGNYDVTLTVTDGNGNVSTKSVTDMIRVNSSCGVDTIPGSTLSLTGANNGYLNLETPNINTNTLTISTWLKPNATQQTDPGLVFSRPNNQPSGLFITNSRELRFAWAGGHFGWSSGLFAPAGKWSHVALVIAPGEATLYLNGESVSRTATFNAVDFNSELNIGRDPGFVDRCYAGEMDEVAIFNRALTKDEIRQMRHLVCDPETDSSLKYYYQFNEAAGPVLDKASLLHGTLVGTAQRAISPIPVGSGVVEKLNVISGGVKDFSSADVKMVFPNTGIYPNGDIYVFKLNTNPNVLPHSEVAHDGKYWIFNNYGSNQTFSALDSIEFSGMSGINIAQIDQYEIYKRGSNSTGTSWGPAIGTADIGTSTSIKFGSSINLTGFSQFGIAQSAILPLDFLGINLTAHQNHKVKIDWWTAAEEDVYIQEIERSFDGRTFSKFQNVYPKGDETINSYSFLDDYPFPGKNYYRIKVINNDGSFQYSEIKTIQLDEVRNVFELYPNPISNNDHFINIQTLYRGTYDFELWTLQGQRIKSMRLEGPERVDLNYLPGGQYTWRIISQRKMYAGRLIVN